MHFIVVIKVDVLHFYVFLLSVEKRRIAYSQSYRYIKGSGRGNLVFLGSLGYTEPMDSMYRKSRTFSKSEFSSGL